MFKTINNLQLSILARQQGYGVPMRQQIGGRNAMDGNEDQGVGK